MSVHLTVSKNVIVLCLLPYMEHTLSCELSINAVHLSFREQFVAHSITLVVFLSFCDVSFGLRLLYSGDIANVLEPQSLSAVTQLHIIKYVVTYSRVVFKFEAI